jgi:hypothetical protein
LGGGIIPDIGKTGNYQFVPQKFNRIKHIVLNAVYSGIFQDADKIDNLPQSGPTSQNRRPPQAGKAHQVRNGNTHELKIA